MPGSSDADVRTVQEEYEDAVPWIRNELLRGSDAVRFRALGLRPRGGDQDVFERFKFLRLVVFEDLELLGLEIENRLAVACRICINPDEIRFGTKDLRWLLWLLGRA
jgi:hypothetical protein